MTDISARAGLPRELRSFAVDDMEITESESDGLTFDGVASVVDTPYTVRDIFGEFQETIAKGAFNRTLAQKDDVRLLREHRPELLLARTKSGTLQLSVDPHLHPVARLDGSDPVAQSVQSAMRRGDLDQMSIGFRARDDEWNDDYTERIVREVELFEVSVVSGPASPTTSAALRSFNDELVALTQATAWDEDDIRRALTHFESLLPPVAEPSFNVAEHLAELLERKPPPVAI